MHDVRTTSEAFSVPELSDGEVIREVIDGDADAFAILVRRHNNAVFRACRAIVRDDAEAEDAVQAAWIKAYRALATFRGDARFRTWVTRIAVHEAAGRTRKRLRFEAVEIDRVPLAAADSPEDAAINDQLGRILEHEVDSLPDGLRLVLVLRDVLELDTAETAACLGIAEEAVRVRLHRARQALLRRFTDPERGELALGSIWRFDGERCARVQAAVLAAIRA
jgi:RNA polymerase sigma-70 factor, ECF subfamily